MAWHCMAEVCEGAPAHVHVLTRHVESHLIHHDVRSERCVVAACPAPAGLLQKSKAMHAHSRPMLFAHRRIVVAP